MRREGTLFYNAAGAVLMELVPPGRAVSPVLERLDAGLAGGARSAAEDRRTVA